MKSFKLVLITAIISFSMVTFANNSSTNIPDYQTKPSKNVIDLTFEQAIQNPGLVIAMYKQVHIDFRSVSANRHTITAHVVHMNYNIRITGTYAQWRLFFKSKWIMSKTVDF